MLAGCGLASGPQAEAGPAHQRVSPLPAPAPASTRQTAAPCRRGEPAELGRRVAHMRRPRCALVGHQKHPAAPASSSAAICAPPLSLLLYPSLARSSDLRHRSPLPPTLGASSSSSSDLLLRIRSHQRLRLALLHPARAQSPSISLERLLELTGVSRTSSNLSVRVVLSPHSTIACVFKRVSSASTSPIVFRPWFAFYRIGIAGPR